MIVYFLGKNKISPGGMKRYVVLNRYLGFLDANEFHSGMFLWVRWLILLSLRREKAKQMAQ